MGAEPAMNAFRSSAGVDAERGGGHVGLELQRPFCASRCHLRAADQPIIRGGESADVEGPRVVAVDIAAIGGEPTRVLQPFRAMNFGTKALNRGKFGGCYQADPEHHPGGSGRTSTTTAASSSPRPTEITDS